MGRPVRDEPAVTRSELARMLAPEIGSISAADRFIRDMFDALGDELNARGEVKIHGLGVFRCLEKKGRRGRNPRTGAMAEIKPRRVVSFVGGAKLKRMVAAGELDTTPRKKYQRRATTAKSTAASTVAKSTAAKSTTASTAAKSTAKSAAKKAKASAAKAPATGDGDVDGN